MKDDCSPPARAPLQLLVAEAGVDVLLGSDRLSTYVIALRLDKHLQRHLGDVLHVNAVSRQVESGNRNTTVDLPYVIRRLQTSLRLKITDFTNGIIPSLPL